MTFFTNQEYNAKYGENIETNLLEAASEMIFAQISLQARGDWNESNVPQRIKDATLEQARFLKEQDIPHVDTNNLKAGEMSADLKSEYSTLALTILSNSGYLYRGSPINYNMGLNISWSE